MRYDTGERTPVDGNQYMYPGENLVVGDHVLLCGSGAPTVRNMTTGTTVLTMPGESDERCAGLAGGAIFLAPWSRTGPLRMYDAEHGSRTVTGIPEGSTRVQVRQGTATHALLRYQGADGVAHRGTIDLADAAVAEDYAAPLASEWHFEAALSDTRIAWNEYDPATKKSTVVVHTRGKAEKQVVEAAKDAHVAFLGDRLVHSAPDGTQALAPSPLNRLNVVDLKTGTTTRLLDHVRAVAAAPDGDLLVSGGQLGTGDGIFRVSVGADGTPTAAFLADGGYPAGFAEVSDPHLPPATVDFDTTYSAPFEQFFNHKGVRFRYTLTHVRTGKTYSRVQNGYVGAGDDAHYPDGIPLGEEWTGTLHGNAAGPDEEMAAYNGAYTWKSVAESGGGFGPPIGRSGSFTVTRAQKPHDFDDNGSPDLLGRDASGVLRTHDSGYIGGGWQIYDRIEATGNIAGTVHADVVARDKAGVLWLYQGDGNGGFAGRVQVGVLWMYLGKGDGTFTGRTRIGGGFGRYSELVGAGDYDRDRYRRNDLLAVDPVAKTTYVFRGTGQRYTPFDLIRSTTPLFQGRSYNLLG